MNISCRIVCEQERRRVQVRPVWPSLQQVPFPVRTPQVLLRQRSQVCVQDLRIQSLADNQLQDAHVLETPGSSDNVNKLECSLVENS